MSGLIPEAGDYEYGVLDNANAPSFFDIPEEENESKDAVAERLERIERENAELKVKVESNASRVPFEQTYQPPANQNTPPPQRQDPAAFRQGLKEAFYADPGVFMENLLITTQQNAEEIANRKYIPIAAQGVRNQIHYYKQGAGMDPAVSKEFDKLVAGIPDAQLAQADQKQIENYLGVLRKQAIGEAYENGGLKKSASAIPTYGGGSGGSTPLKPNYRRINLNAAQQEAMKEIDSNPHYKNWTPAQKLEALKDFE